ncbi:penicillin-binding protein 1B [Aurantivibrio plasticivorans]
MPALLGSVWAAYLDWVVRDKFEGKKWALPARVYAQPLELYAGLPLRLSEMVSELNALGYQRNSRVTKAGRYWVDGAQVQLFSRGFSFWDGSEQPQAMRVSFDGDVVSALHNAAGQDLAIVRIEPQEIGGIYPAHMEDRLLVRLQDIPPLLGETLIAVEDRRFLEHFGISLRGIARAAYMNMKAGQVVQGGSTLTQQLVKNFYLNHERSLVRKFNEAIMAISLDFHYSKSEILETYLNEVYLGQSGARGIHGFALGAQHYFRQPLRELKIHQIALLVGLVKGASYYNPWRNPERATERRDVVIRLMRENDLINPLEAELALKQPLDVVAESASSVYSYPAFIDLVKRQLQRDYDEDDLRSEGLRVFTTLSPRVQSAVQSAISQRLTRLESDYQLDAKSLQGAAIVTDVGSGEVLAVVGDRQARASGFNRALDAKRPIGSLAKPAIYLAALNDAARYTLITPIDDSELSVFIDGNNIWQPKNFSLESHGVVPLYQGLAQSYNQASARLGYTVGVDTVIDTLHSLGLQVDIPELPAILLGSIDLSPADVVAMYQTIAAEGVYTPQRAIRSVLTAEGQPLARYPLDADIRFDPASVQLLQFALQATMREGTGKTVYRTIDERITIAGKTGTTNDQRDSWFAGFTGDHLAVVWVGRDDNGATPLTGATGAMRVWGDIFNDVPTRSLEIFPDKRIQRFWVDPVQNGLSRERCRSAVAVPFIKGSEPKVTVPCRH